MNPNKNFFDVCYSSCVFEKQNCRFIDDRNLKKAITFLGRSAQL